MSGAAPLVSIGLPVFNGCPYVGTAIESVLTQSFADFELIIADEQSTDGTFATCLDYAARDSRIRLSQNPRRLGIYGNHNRVFELSRGRYFHWMGADDAHHPDFLQRSVAELEARPDRVVCHSAVSIIDSHGDQRFVYLNALEGTRSPDPAQRLRAIVLEDVRCNVMYGLIRRDALLRTGLHGFHHNSDRVLMGQLALMGPFAYVAECLYLNRLHKDEYSRQPRHHDAAVHTPGASLAVGLPRWHSFLRYAQSVAELVEDPADRRRCYGMLAACFFRPSHLTSLLADVVGWASPRTFETLRRLRWPSDLRASG